MQSTANMYMIGEMRSIIERLNAADAAYYKKDTEIMSNRDYDILYDTLREYESKTGIILSGSPTVKVSGEASSSLEKVHHETPMLSLDKTKDKNELLDWLGDKPGALTWKMDGLTLVLTYEDGKLQKAVTRGTGGEIGELVTENARNFKNVPVTIPEKEKIVIRGEAVISYADFERINRTIPDTDAHYKNPRNLASGSVRQLDASITAQRSVQFIAFKLITDNPVSLEYDKQMEFLRSIGFHTVMPVIVTKDNLLTVMDMFEKMIPENPFPSDGLVLTFNDTVFADSRGTTSKYPLGSMAFKWKDETAETKLRHIEWSASRTGLINPVAVFDPVELEDTTVERASVHNISIIEDLQLGENDTLLVYKANKIIPQIAENLTKTNTWKDCFLPHMCPVCKQPVRIETNTDHGNCVKTLRCDNSSCPAKHIKKFDLMAEKTALDIKGMSENIIEKLMNAGLIKEFADFFRLKDNAEIIAGLDKMGETSAQNLIASIEKSRHTTFQRMLRGAGIPLVGNSQSKEIAKRYNDIESLARASVAELASIPGIGEIKAKSIHDTLANTHQYIQLKNLQDYLVFKSTKDTHDANSDSPLTGKTVVITGILTHYANRNELEALIESKGGKTSRSVSKKTTVLVNNDCTSDSAKNKKAKELNIPIMTEEQFIAKYLTE